MQCVYGRPPFRETCTIGPPATLFDDVLLICNYDYEVDCGDRPIIDGNTPSPTIPTTTVQVTTTTVSVRLHHTYFTHKHARARSQTSADFDSCIYIHDNMRGLVPGESSSKIGEWTHKLGHDDLRAGHHFTRGYDHC